MNMTFFPEDMRPINDSVIVRRVKPQTETVVDPLKGGNLDISFDALPSGIVMANTKKDITRAVVISAGPDAIKQGITPGMTVGIPGKDQDDGTPQARMYDPKGQMWEIWSAWQIRYKATIRDMA